VAGSPVRLPRYQCDRGIHLKQQLRDKPIEYKPYIDRYGEDMPEIREWKWSNPE
jgi:xylulose-5-phosphate/fructose-6-phosphate phosphoketolase